MSNISYLIKAIKKVEVITPTFLFVGQLIYDIMTYAMAFSALPANTLAKCLR